MSQTTKIQIPLSRTLRVKAERVARGYGYSSLQEVVRVFLNSFANKQIQPTFVSDTVEVLSPSQDRTIVRRAKEVYKAMKEDELYEAASGSEILRLAEDAR